MHSNCIAKVYQVEKKKLLTGDTQLTYTELESYTEGSAGEKAQKAIKSRDELNNQRKVAFGKDSLKSLWYTAEMEYM